MRTEYDLLGSVEIPDNIYYGVQTLRAKENFILSEIPLKKYPQFIRALAMVKLAAAKANHHIGSLSDHKAQAIIKACKDIINYRYHKYFIVDMIQGGAGTSTNMNANEVICNIALRHMGEELGSYHKLHPNNDVNMSQSTNDVYPTALRLTLLLSHGELIKQLIDLKDSFRHKALTFVDIIKMGRTQLQDAVPMTVSQEFNAWAHTLEEDAEKIVQHAHALLEINLGGTAIGTGINANRDYSKKAIEELRAISGFSFVQSDDLVEASSDMGAFVLFSSGIKRLAIKLSKIANDLRLLSMGPRTGINELNLPAQQPGSSIMPGKVNPVIPEAVNQVAYQIMGNDLSTCMAAEAGQLQLNAMEPLIAYNLLESLKLLSKAIHMFNEKCVKGITVNEEHCSQLVKNSIGIITAITPHIGYDNASRIAKSALMNKRSIIDLLREEGLLTEAEINQLLKPENMVSKAS